MKHRIPWGLILCTGCLVVVGFLIWRATRPQDLQTEYREMMSRVRYPSAATIHFPSRIPEEAETVSMDLSRTIGQGGTELTLEYTVSDAEVLSDYLRRWGARAVWSGPVSDTSRAEYGSFSDFTEFFSSDTVPEDLQIYIFYSQQSRRGTWNHGTIGYAAVSQSLNYVLFRYEEW